MMYWYNIMQHTFICGAALVCKPWKPQCDFNFYLLLLWFQMVSGLQPALNVYGARTLLRIVFNMTGMFSLTESATPTENSQYANTFTRIW